jgi:Flp pilus assembly protein TadB
MFLDRIPLPLFVVRVVALRRLTQTTAATRTIPGVFRRRQTVDPALQAAGFLDTVDRHVRLGSSLRGAITAAATECDPSLSETIRVLLLHCRTGAPLDDDEVLADAAQRPSNEAFLIRSLVAAGAGGPGASFALQRAAWALRERHAVASERRMYAAQSVFAARVLSWLPVVFGVLMLLTNGSVRSAYFGGVAGFACVVVGIGLNVAGRKWMKRITCSFA